MADSNFNLESYTNLIHDLCNKTTEYMVEYKTKFHESFRSNPFAKITPYIKDTVKYGLHNDTKNRLLFGGEADYITVPIYDTLGQLAIWRLFNVLNEVELIKLKNKYPEDDIRLAQNFGTKFVIHMRRKDVAYDREFEVISNPKIFIEVLDYIKRFRHLEMLEDLYNRFKLFGFIDWLDSISDIDEYCNNLQETQLSKKQISVIDLNEFADVKCWMLSSIYTYCQWYVENVDDVRGLKNYYIENLFDKSEDHIKKFILNKFKDVMSFAYSIQFPVLYNLKK